MVTIWTLRLNSLHHQFHGMVFFTIFQTVGLRLCGMARPDELAVHRTGRNRYATLKILSTLLPWLR
jgi:hypothetical protein